MERRLHDRKLADEISRIPEDEWEEWGDNYERPFGEGSSEEVGGEVFKIYFKGLVEERRVRTVAKLGGIGVAICDSRNDLLFELRKPVVSSGLNKNMVEFMALMEGLNAALSLDLSTV